MMTPDIIITGPTACGKTSKGVALAESIGGEILSADSRQIYRGMDIGTGKDLADYRNVKYHLIDIANAGYRYNLYEYLRDFRTALADVRCRQHPALVVGGTGLYVESIARGIRLPEVPENPELRARLADKSLSELALMLASMKKLHNTTDLDTQKRAIRAIEIETYYHDHPEAAHATQPDTQRYQPPVIVLDIPRQDRRNRITARLRQRLEQGMLDEVRTLLDSGIAPDDLMYYGLEYKFLTLHVIGQLSYASMFAQLEAAIHQFAKRQMTWFRGMERRGCRLNWVPYDMPDNEFVDYSRNLMYVQQSIAKQ